jgi:hypothetical protein
MDRGLVGALIFGAVWFGFFAWVWIDRFGW